MPAEIPAEALQLRSLVSADQTLELFLDMVPMSLPGEKLSQSLLLQPGYVNRDVES